MIKITEQMNTAMNTFYKNCSDGYAVFEAWACGGWNTFYKKCAVLGAVGG